MDEKKKEVPTEKDPVKKASAAGSKGAKLEKKVKELEAQLAELEVKCKEEDEKYLRIAAEYDNFRKSTQKEKEELFSFVTADVAAKMLPALDALEQAESFGEDATAGLRESIPMIKKLLYDALQSVGVEEISCEGGFDPNLHNAMQHTTDDTLPENCVAEVFQKGYKIGDKVVRYALVKVAN